jgi:hypothetical protein
LRGRGRANTTAALRLDLDPTIVCMGLLPAWPRQDDLGPTLKICSPILPCRTSFQAAPMVGSAPDSKQGSSLSQEIPCLRKAVTKGEKTPSHARSSDLRKIASDLRLQETSNRRNHESARHLSVTGARPPLSYFPLVETWCMVAMRGVLAAPPFYGSASVVAVFWLDLLSRAARP